MEALVWQLMGKNFQWSANGALTTELLAAIFFFNKDKENKHFKFFSRKGRNNKKDTWFIQRKNETGLASRKLV